jgi:SnoaL-like domain
MDAPDRDRILQMLWDKDQIRDLIARFSLYADLNEPEKLVGLLTEDGVIDIGPGRRRVGRDAMLRGGQETLSGAHTSDPEGVFEASSHHNANVLIEFTGPDSADVKTWLIAWHLISGQTPHVYGVYFDKVVRTPDGWRFRERQLRVASNDKFPGTRTFYPLERRPLATA